MSTPTTGTTLGIGIMNLTPSDSVEKPAAPLDHAFENPIPDGVAVRTQWSKVQPAKDEFYGTYLDSAKTLAKETGKKWSALVTAGVTTPQWVYDAGAFPFTVTVDTKTGEEGTMPLPWDQVFQEKWFAFLQSWFKRYGGHDHLASVVMGGFGRRAESYFVSTPEDIAELDGIAREDGYTSGMAAWIEGTKAVIDKYAELSKVPFILDLGAPAPTDEGKAALQTVCDYGDDLYHGRFAVKSDGLSHPDGPPNKSIGATQVQKMSPYAPVGYQFGLPSKEDVEHMKATLRRGIEFGAHFLEVYKGDCDHEPHHPALTEASTALLAG